MDRAGRLESSILLINTPECLISEGLADLGVRFAAPPAGRVDLLVEILERAGLPIATDPAAAREAATLAVGARRAAPRARLDPGQRGAPAPRRGRSHEEVLGYLMEVGRYSSDVAAKRLEFIEHPLWRTYVFVYAEGEALLGRWLDAVPESERPARFDRLLREQLTPPAVTGPG